MKHFALLGHPLGHSFSPKLHNSIFQILGLDDRVYEFCDTSAKKLASVMGQLKLGKYDGFSVTIPHKQAVMGYLDEITHRARTVGAVNTILRRDDGSLWGDNTDYLGFEKALEEGGVFGLQVRSALVLGSGGVARAVIAVLKDHGFKLRVASLSPDNEEDLKDHVEVEVLGYSDLDPDDEYSVIVNCTPVGMSPKTGVAVIENKTWFRPERVFIDVVYNPRVTYFLELAKLCGARIVTGDRMFLWQAIAQAKLFCENDNIPVEFVERLLAAHYIS